MAELTSRRGWTRVALGDVVQRVDEVGVPTSEESRAYIGLEHLDSGSYTVTRWGSDVDLVVPKTRIRKGDVLFARRNTHLKRCAVAPFDTWFSPDGYTLRSSSASLLQSILIYIVASEGFMNFAIEHSAGTHSKRVKWEDLARFEFALPPLEEQRRIVEALEAIGSASEALGRAQLASRRARIAVAIRLFTEDSAGEKHQLSSLIAGSMYGPRFSSSLYADDGPLAQLRTTDISEDGEIDYAGIPRAQLNPVDYAVHLLQDRDVVISRSGTTGITAVFRDTGTPTIPAAFLIRLRTNDRLVPEYLHEYFASPLGRQVTASLSRGGVQKNINGTQLLCQSVPCPGHARQERVAATIQRLRSSEQVLARRSRQLRGPVASLVATAMGGGKT
jgi:hypothetical protein